MSEQSKKDLTGVFELGLSADHADAPFPGTIDLELSPENPVAESIDSFESLEDLQAHAPESDLAALPFSLPTEYDSAPEDELVSIEEFASNDSIEAPEPLVQPPPVPLPVAQYENEPPTPKPAVDSIALLKEFAERIPVGNPVVAAAYPFSLRIEGVLTPEEKEKLVDLLNRENMGIREVDLEPQLQANRILIPRISEFAAILLVQALRGINADMRFGPSDSIYSTAETRTPEDENAPLPQHSSQVYGGTDGHAAESLPITTLSFLPELPHFNVIEVLTASASLRSQAVEAETSGEYQTMLDNLQREIRYKAFHKGATAVVNYTVTLIPLNLPSHYRLTATGTAIRPKPFV